MSTRTVPPFRADHVGSFLRPKYLLDAREQKARGEITAEQLRAVEDRAITEIVKFQEGRGAAAASPTASSAAPTSTSTFSSSWAA